MATTQRQFQFCWRLPARIFVALSAVTCALVAHGQDRSLASGYEPHQGEPFFLLSDAVIGSNEQARVRLELTSPNAAQELGGVDVSVYRIEKPLDFLKAQKNLHRINLGAKPQEEGAANVLTHLWDAWAKKARTAWQGLFTKEARTTVTADAPGTKRSPRLYEASKFEQPARFAAPTGMQPIAQFRYPVTKAVPIKPPEGVKLPGSSSEFKLASEGNVYLPLGKLAPGLYAVQAALGMHRAATVVFVSDTISVTKSAPKQLLVWTTHRITGAPVANADLLWTDGVGVLQTASTDVNGLANLNRASPEQSYVIGQDAKGGVFITENFYYDSEIYNTKLYAVTDRPLYRPGDTVMVKFVGREFVSARQSNPVSAGEIALTVFDPNGLAIANARTNLSPEAGGDTSFRLPQNAVAGGYELRFSFKDNSYAAAFRVSEYQKPHFEMTVLPDKADFKTNEAVTGKLQLNYPDGKPVKDAVVDLTGRSQALTMVDGELDYAGQFPLKLSTSTLKTDGNGVAKFTLPAAAVPSRYILSALATDGAAYRVRTSRELLIERAAALWSMRAAKQFSAANEKITFTLTPGTPSAADAKPVQWDWVRLEDRATSKGQISNAGTLELAFDKPGTYTVTARDEKGNVLAAAPHWVSGAGIKPASGNIDMVANKPRYAPGEVAQVLITFPEPVEHALFTLERDAIEQTALLKGNASWLSAAQIAPNQWRADVKVAVEYAPNITLSVAYVKNGEFVFQNQGLAVEQSRIELAIKPSKQSYAPGETATVEVLSTIGGKAAPATLAIGVVDEMIYVLQPEIAPSILDFFYHPRRNNVRTTSTQSFIAYDLASNAGGAQPRRRGAPERAVKVLERPRREEVDTAFWSPAIQTDAAGKAVFSFRVPDSLTRWRVTARAFDANGVMGQKTAHVLSDKPYYVKWTSPNWLREGDAPIASLAVFNNTQKDEEIELFAKGAGLNLNRKFTARPGANFVPVSFGEIKQDPATKNTPLALTLSAQGKEVDALSVALAARPTTFTRQATQTVDLAADAKLTLPQDASNVSVSLVSDVAAQFNRVSEDLIDYPYGCVEQTASRMVPLALALRSAGQNQERQIPLLTQRLAAARVRLSFMAGANARFGWWGSHMTEDPFMTVYAYYADWLATQTLKQTLPADHWQRLQEVYAKAGFKAPVAQRALMLHFMAKMNLPVASLNEQLAQDVVKGLAQPLEKGKLERDDSLPLSQPNSELAHAFALVLANETAQGRLTGEAATQLGAAREVLRASEAPLARALRVMSGQTDAKDAQQLLTSMAASNATLDRAIALAWLYGSSARGTGAGKVSAALDAPWKLQPSLFDYPVYRLPENTTPPDTLKIKAAADPGTVAMVNYDIAESTRGTLPVALTRKLFRLQLESALGETSEKQETKGAKSGSSKNRVESTEFAARGNTFNLVPVADGEPVSSNELYLEQIELTPSDKAKRALEQGLIQVGLPPGASMEPSTWGIAVRFPGGKEAIAMNRAVAEPTSYGYAVPVQLLRDTPVGFSHLVRFSQKGSYTVPRARFHLMYQPGEVAHEAGPASSLTRKLTVN